MMAHKQLSSPYGRRDRKRVFLYAAKVLETVYRPKGESYDIYVKELIAELRRRGRMTPSLRAYFEKHKDK